MKKFIIIILSLLVLSGLAAAELKYWTSTAYLQRIPRLYDDGDILSRAATVFTPAANCQLQGVYFPFYGAGAAGQANVREESAGKPRWNAQSADVPLPEKPFCMPT